MLNGRERLKRVLDFEPVEGGFMWGLGAWQETLEVWRTQGWDGRPFEEHFPIDQIDYMGVYYGPAPDFAYEVLAEDDLTRTFINHEGILMREFKQHRDTSMPQFLKFPVADAEDFEKLAAERLGLNREVRFTEKWKVHVREGAQSPWPRLCWADRWGGFFGPLRNLMGLENLCMAFYDQPALVERMMEQRADAMIQITEEVMRHTEFEAFWMWEDMAYNHASLIDPKRYRRFALKHYRRVCDWLHDHGVKHIGLDSDGDIHELIPIWLDAGIDALWPFEVQAGMDVFEMRRTYGRNMAMFGGLDKRALIQGPEAIHREVDRVMPLVEQGGYVPGLDHSAPPDITWPNFCEYNRYLLYRLGRG